jgi:drug/metabolite transporter (DMT)-like permease
MAGLRPSDSSEFSPKNMYPHGASATFRGIALYLAAIFLFACLDTLAKYLTRDYNVMQIAWGRYAFHAAFLLFLMPRHGVWRPLRSARPGFQVIRAFLLMVVSLLFFISVSFLPVANVTAIGFVAPLILTALAHFVLHEKVRIRRWAAICAGFIGVLVIIRPGLGVMHWAAFIALAMAACNALYHLATRMLAGIDSAETTIFYTGLVGALGFSLLVPFFWEATDLVGWLGMIAIGLFGGLGHYMLIQAYTLAPASLLAPFSYSAIIWVTILGYLIFGDFPDGWTSLGTSIIIASGIYVFYREAKLRRAGKG